MSSIVSDNPTTTTTGTTTTATGHTHQRLFYLHDLPDFKVHHDDADVRGWKVKLSTGETVGTVENLIVDKGARKVRYLEVTGDRNFYKSYGDNGYYLDNDSGRVYDADHDEHFIVPIGVARLDHSDNEVYLEGVTTNVLGGIPRYRRGSQLSPRYEIETLNYLSDNDNEYSSSYNRSMYKDFDSNQYRSLDDGFYTSGYFSDDRYYNRHEEAISSKGL